MCSKCTVYCQTLNASGSHCSRTLPLMPTTFKPSGPARTSNYLSASELRRLRGESRSSTSFTVSYRHTIQETRAPPEQVCFFQCSISNLAGSDGMRFILVRVKATLNPIRVGSVSRVRNRARKWSAQRGSTDEMWEPSALKRQTLLFIFDSMA